MKISDICLIAACLSLSAQPALAEKAGKEAPVTFRAMIGAEKLVEDLCVLKATKEGKLAPNVEFNVLSSEENGGLNGEIEVTQGNFPVKLTASERTLTREKSGASSRSELVENVFVSSGIRFGRRDVPIYGEPSPVNMQLKRNGKKQPVTVWFHAKLNNDSSTFEPGVYKGQTTITCEPGDLELPE